MMEAVDIWTELLDDGNLTDHHGLSIDSYRPGVSSLPLRGGKVNLDGVETEREPTNHAPRVRAWVLSRIPIMEGLMDFLVA